jgi:hypothetical protein
MKFEPKQPPRHFRVGKAGHIELKDCGTLLLETDEVVTFKTASGTEYDVTRKSWGYYATPSLNARLKQFGLRSLLVKSPGDRYFIMLVEQGKEDEFHAYLEQEEQVIVAWLDDTDTLLRLEKSLDS